MPHTLPAIIAHVTAQNRPGSHGAILVREIERLRVENARLEAQIRINAEAHFRPLKETTDV